jgi:D-glycero-alpha-D-manno-heptose-7-phosphate kinase
VIIETSAPTRIDLAGGTMDIWPLYLFHPGAQTLNAAISIRARARIEPNPEGRIVMRSLDTKAVQEAGRWQDLRDAQGLRLLALLVHAFEVNGITLTTTSESPAGAGIAGSSALNVAVAAGLAEWTGRRLDPEALLQIAMNVEAQVIGVPTGVQDYRPALYGGVAAVELGIEGVRRVPLDIDHAELERRLVLCYTGEPHNSGTNNWEITKRHIDGDRHVFDCFERIRDTAVRMRACLAAGDWDGVGSAIDAEWANRQRLAPGVTTAAIDALIARARRGCLFCYGPPSARGAIAEALASGGARLLDFTFDMRGLVRG